MKVGLDLTLMPIHHDRFGSEANIGTTELHCERRRDLFEAIMELPVTVLPATTPFSTYHSDYRCPECDNSCYGDTHSTPYGEPITWVPVSALLLLADHPGVRDNYLNRAVWAYLRELPPMQPVVLYWN